mgnify:CR=1 FL=1
MQNHGSTLDKYQILGWVLVIFAALSFYTCFTPFLQIELIVGFSLIYTSLLTASIWTSVKCSRCELSVAIEERQDGLKRCEICNKFVPLNSKHCMKCEKCIEDFDHHCKWLNNCIAKRNYKFFITAVNSLCILCLFQIGVGAYIIAGVFTQDGLYDLVKERVGYSLWVFFAVVIVSALVSVVVSGMLLYLIFFHLMLKKKGLTTYDYIVQKRSRQSQELAIRIVPAFDPPKKVAVLNSSNAYKTNHSVFISSTIDTTYYEHPDERSFTSRGNRKKGPHHNSKRSLPSVLKVFTY